MTHRISKSDLILPLLIFLCILTHFGGVSRANGQTPSKGHTQASTTASTNGAQHSGIHIIITDRGINQYIPETTKGNPRGGPLPPNYVTPGVRLGDDFGRWGGGVMPNIPPLGQIAVPMPPRDKIPTTEQGWNDLSSKIHDVVKAKMDAGLRRGVTEFEVLLVQDIGTKEHLANTRWFSISADLVQSNVETFTQKSLVGLNRVAEHYSQKSDVKVDAVVGSNGGNAMTRVLPQVAAAGKNPINGKVVLVDPRSTKKDVVETAKAIGPEKVVIINNKGDYPALRLEIGRGSIVANHEVAKEIKRELPGVTLLRTNTEGPNFLGNKHVTQMVGNHPVKRRQVTEVEEFIGRKDEFGQEIYVKKNSGSEEFWPSVLRATPTSGGVLSLNPSVPAAPKWKPSSQSGGNYSVVTSNSTIRIVAEPSKKITTSSVPPTPAKSPQPSLPQSANRDSVEKFHPTVAGQPSSRETLRRGSARDATSQSTEASELTFDPTTLTPEGRKGWERNQALNKPSAATKIDPIWLDRWREGGDSVFDNSPAMKDLFYKTYPQLDQSRYREPALYRSPAHEVDEAIANGTLSLNRSEDGSTFDPASLTPEERKGWEENQKRNRPPAASALTDTAAPSGTTAPPATGGIYLGGKQTYKENKSLVSEFEHELNNAEAKPKKQKP